MTWLSRREWLRQAAVGAGGVIVACATALPRTRAQEPHVANRPHGGISDADEIALGRRFAIQFEQEVPILTNPLIDQHLGVLIKELAAQCQRPRLPYRVKVVDSASVNASSLPGGSIYVNRGLLNLLTTEDELAAVIAHEIGHIVGRHTINQLMLALQAKELLKPILDNLNKQNGAVEKIILQLGGAVAIFARLHFSRQDEAEADLLGFYNVLRANWDPRGFLKMFVALEALEKTPAGASLPLLSSHPPTPAREAAIERELTFVTIPEDAQTDSFDFRACKTALRLLPPPRKPAPSE